MQFFARMTLIDSVTVVTNPGNEVAVKVNVVKLARLRTKPLRRSNASMALCVACDVCLVPPMLPAPAGVFPCMRGGTRAISNVAPWFAPWLVVEHCSHPGCRCRWCHTPPDTAHVCVHVCVQVWHGGGAPPCDVAQGQPGTAAARGQARV